MSIEVIRGFHNVPLLFFCPDNIHLQWFAEHATADIDHEMDEPEKYLQADIPIDIGNVLAKKQWSESSRQARYPLLSKMAIHILSISAMAAEVE